MRVAAVALLLLVPQDDKGEPFYKFKKGTTWIYAQDENGEKSTVTIKVIKEDGGKVFYEMTDDKKKDDEMEAPAAETFAWYVEDGFLVWAMKDEDSIQPLFKVLKIGSKKDDTWDGMAQEGAEGKATHMGTEEVKVPAGTYKDVVHVRLKLGDSGTLEFWLAPKVGVVKIKSEVGAEKTELALKEHKEGK